MAKVSISKCDSYSIKAVRTAVRQSVEHLGGMSAFVNPGDRVLLKVNLLMRRKPEKVTTTHPYVAQAVAELVLEAGGKPMIGDSPGGYHFYNRKVLEAVYETCGMKQAALISGAELNYNTEAVDVPFPEGRIMKSIKTIKPVLEADKIINLPKIKTHMMTVYSGAVKNLFGIIPGSYKSEYHLRFEDTRDFADLLIDICMFSKPVLTVMDAVEGMEGYGPAHGNPRKVGLIISGTDPYNLDVAASKIIGFGKGQIPTVVKSIERGLCKGDTASIEMFGESLEDVLVPNFKKPTRKISFNFYNVLLPKCISKLLNSVIKPKPQFDLKKCKSCGVCARSCPPGVIQMYDGKPTVDLGKCIRCFCCHELCECGAVKIKRPWFIKILLR